MNGDDMFNMPPHKGVRGSIHRHDMITSKFLSIKTNKGMYRGGEIHSNDKYIVVLHGEVEVVLKQNNKDTKIKLKKNDFFKVPKNTPNYLFSITDSDIIEWWDGEFDVQYYKEYRERIENVKKLHESKK